MMRKEQGEWVADSMADLVGWVILAGETWKDDVRRLTILRGTEQRMVYMGVTNHPQTRDARPQTLIMVIENGVANTVVEAIAMNGGGKYPTPFKVIVHRDVVVGEVLELI
jgi:hypothetical protein